MVLGTVASTVDVAGMQQQVQVVCPEGCSPGDLVAITTPEGQQLQVQIPPGVTVGTAFLVNAEDTAQVVRNPAFVAS